MKRAGPYAGTAIKPVRARAGGGCPWIIRNILAVVALAMLSALATSSAVESATRPAAGVKSLTGTLEVVITDDFERNRSKTYYSKSGKKKTLKRSVLKSRMSLKSLPKQDIKGLRVELNPSESRFLRNPKGCKKPLKFLAFITTSDGKRHVLSQKIKLKGKGCSKKKRAKKKRVK